MQYINITNLKINNDNNLIFFHTFISIAHPKNYKKLLKKNKNCTIL